MFRSMPVSRIAVAVAFILALVLSTAPARALPGDSGSQFDTLESSWFDMALSWFQGLLGGSDLEPQSRTTALSIGTWPGEPGGGVGTMSGSCIDPYGNPCEDIP